MIRALAFDVYGTLVDPLGLKDVFNANPHQDLAAEILRFWRWQQLEYTWRRSLMERYVDFDTVVLQALQITFEHFEIKDVELESRLISRFNSLPAFPEVLLAFENLATSAGLDLVAFSNGTSTSLEPLLANAGLRPYIKKVVTVEGVGSYKPSPLTYRHLCQELFLSPNEVALVSANHWDVSGARAASLEAFWIDRSTGALYDHWAERPTKVFADLLELAAYFGNMH